MNAAFFAEALKVRRSAASYIPLVGLAISLLQGGLFLLSPDAVHTWNGLTAWQTLWITFLLPLFLALLAGLTAGREQKAQGGGLWWRAASWNVQAHAELLWLGLLSLLLNAAVVLPTLLFGALTRLPDELPWLRLLELTLVLTLTSLPLLALGQRLSRRFGLVAGLITALLGNIAGILMSEGQWWWFNPWAWPIRATFTLSGTAANGIPLSPESLLWRVSPWPVMGLSLLVALGLSALPYTLPKMGGATHRRAAMLKPWHWNGLLAAELVKYRHTALPWLVAVTPLMVTLLSLLRLDAKGVWEVWTLLVLPFATALLPALTWGHEADHWRILRTRAAYPAQLYGVKLLAMWSAALLSGAVLFIGTALLGKPFPAPMLLFALYALSALAFLTFHLWSAVRFSPGFTLGIGVVTTLLALILGGTGLGGSIWPLFPWVWARIVPFSESVAWPYLLTLLVLGTVFALLGTRAATRE